MRVLHVDTAREWRGGQTQLLHLLATRREDEVALPPDAPLRPALEALGVRVHSVPFRGAWRGSAALARLVRERRPDLVAAHTSHAHRHAWRAGEAPVVVHRRSDFPPKRLSRPRYLGVAGYVAVSAAVREVLVGAGVCRDRVAVVHDGVPAERYTPQGPALARTDLRVPRDAFLVGAVGALVAHKGHEVLVEAVARLRRAGIPAVAVILGEGVRRRALLRQARALGVADAVRLPGSRADVAPFLRALDVLAHPSREEGLGQAVIEARLVGVPVVASTAGGLPEALERGRAGWLVAPGDPTALARALAAVHSDPGAARARAEAGRDGAKAFDVGRCVAGTEAAWRRLVPSPG